MCFDRLSPVTDTGCHDVLRLVALSHEDDAHRHFRAVEVSLELSGSHERLPLLVRQCIERFELAEAHGHRQPHEFPRIRSGLAGEGAFHGNELNRPWGLGADDHAKRCLGCPFRGHGILLFVGVVVIQRQPITLQCVSRCANEVVEQRGSRDSAELVRVDPHVRTHLQPAVRLDRQEPLLIEFVRLLPPVGREFL